jgi:hypothetical protein
MPPRKVGVRFKPSGRRQTWPSSPPSGWHEAQAMALDVARWKRSCPVEKTLVELSCRVWVWPVASTSWSIAGSREKTTAVLPRKPTAVGWPSGLSAVKRTSPLSPLTNAV